MMSKSQARRIRETRGIVRLASLVAEAAHRGQVRKYTGEPYINHPREVADIVRSVAHTDEMIAAAWLHDVLEDTQLSADALRVLVGESVVSLVRQLTDVSKPSDGNRATRKAMDRAHLAAASPEAKTVKLADLISNTSSIVRYDPEFAVTYLAEKRLLLPFLREGDATLWERANELAKRST